MRVLKKILMALAGIIALFLLAVFLFIRGQKPSYKGTVELMFLTNPVEVYFDDYGVPHIYAESESDAMKVLGYIHAMERLWQIELLKRIAPGRLSELFGEATLDTDKFFASSGIAEHSHLTQASMPRPTTLYDLILDYGLGVNEFIKEGKKPLEFTLLGLEPEEFTREDMWNIVGYMSFSFAMAQKTDPLLSYIHRNLGEEYLQDFGMDSLFNAVKIPTDTSYRYDELSIFINKIIEKCRWPHFHGSNSWVLGPEKTSSGKVIFANDPHIAFSQPGTWYEAHIHTPKYEMYGYYLPGVPFPLLGHNRQYAYGLTMFENDDIDFFEIEPISEDTYRYGKDTLNFISNNKQIKLKSGSTVELQHRTTHLGPVINDVIDIMESKVPIAMNWTYLQEDNPIYALYGLSHANSLKDYIESVSKIHSPGLNVMYGDADDNIAWVAAAKLYRYQHEKSTFLLMDGSNGEDDIKEYFTFNKNPRAINPPSNYVYSANNQPQSIDGYHYPGYYVPSDRAERITDLLNQDKKWSKEDVAEMILDDVSYSARDIAHFVAKTIGNSAASENQKRAVQALISWDGKHSSEAMAPLVFNQILYHYLENTFKDELGDKRFEALLHTHILKQMIPHHIMSEDSPWWDNVDTKDVRETRAEIIKKSFQEAIAGLELLHGRNADNWKWKNAARLELKHPMGEVKILRKLFNVGPKSVSGGNETINNMIFTYGNTAEYPILAGPSTRRIIDFADIENSISILPSGQSGHISSPHYKDQYQMYIEGRFRKMLLNKKDFENTKNIMRFIRKQ
jgi:penicillin G amidase